VRQLDRMEVRGAFLSSDTPITNFAEQSKLLATIQAKTTSGQQEPITYEIPLTREQLRQKASFAVKAINRKGKDAGFSNVSSLVIMDLPEPPVDLQATLTEKVIQLSWKPAPLSGFGGPAPPADGYRIYRAEEGSQQPVQEIGASVSPSYQDTSFQFGHNYEYSIRAFVGTGESAALTPSSSPVELAAIDRFPPAAPRNLRAIPVPGAVEMAWSPNPEADLAGYNVYRNAAGGPGSPFSKLNPELLPIVIFRDANVTAGTRYTYRVTAVDKSGNESAPSEDTSVTAE